MKINADYRNIETVDEIADDLILTLTEWQTKKRDGAIKSLSLYINDYYYDYALSEKEFDEIEEIVIDWFTKEE